MGSIWFNMVQYGSIWFNGLFQIDPFLLSFVVRSWAQEPQNLEDRNSLAKLLFTADCKELRAAEMCWEVASVIGYSGGLFWKAKMGFSINGGTPQ